MEQSNSPIDRVRRDRYQQIRDSTNRFKPHPSKSAVTTSKSNRTRQLISMIHQKNKAQALGASDTNVESTEQIYYEQNQYSNQDILQRIQEGRKMSNQYEEHSRMANLKQ